MKNTMIYKAAMLMAALVLLVAACNDSSPQASADIAPYAKLDMAGADALLAKNAGKPVLLCFWTTWCPACREEIPILRELSAQYGDKVKIAAVSLDENKADLEKFFQNATPGLDVYMGTQALAGKYGVTAIPHLVIHGPDGEVALSKPGLFPGAMLTSIIDKLLEH
ncbi:TlpA family protein disulfide reductase [Salidesulfovibrio onnuriiensis]|uniref:TlpA family protein disulfide reductase n=1 Tax=Salidesulfovibrio onnuriiensis TaxID=2583823 RepID=UPI0011CAF6D9|nr:thioredoxin-like domain-containing protein [Salidesulfovibrio onnuriiensis]